MAIVWMEGWEGFGNSADFERIYSGLNSGSADIVAGRSGDTNAKAMRNDNGAIVIYAPVSVGSNVIVFGMAFKRETLLTNSDIIRLMAVTNPDSEQIVLRLNSTGELSVDRGSTNLGNTSGLGMLANNWYYIEISVTLTDGATGTLQLHVNDQQEINLSSVQTRNVAGENIGRIEFPGNSTNFNFFDDCYLLDNTGSDQTTRIGDCVIETVFPDANGTTNNFTASPAVSNYLNVDDGNAPDDDTTYNHSATATDKDLYGFAALTGNVGDVYAVQVRNFVRKESGGSRGIQTVARSSATEVNGTEYFVGNTYGYYSHIYENDPNGGGAWTESSVNAAEFGIRIST